MPSGKHDHEASTSSGPEGLTTRPSTSTAMPTLSPEVFDNEVVPSSLGNIVPILRVASEIEPEHPRVAYICRFYAFKKAQRSDPASIGKGVRRFKTSLSQRLERDDVSTLTYRVKKTDAREIESFYRQYYEHYVRTLDKGEQADRDKLGKTYQTAGVLFEVMCAFSKTEVSPEGEVIDQVAVEEDRMDPVSSIEIEKRKRPPTQSQATSYKEHQIDPEEVLAPCVILVQGPPNVGKSLLIKSLIKFYSKRHLNDIRGPITIIADKKRRLQLVECPNDVCGMIDAAKYADVVLLLIDASCGFEMETLEFLNLLQVHCVPKVMGVLTHLDEFKNKKKMRETKLRLSFQFRTEVYDEADLFYLSGLDRGMYRKSQVHELARFISDMKLHPLSWRAVHPYVLVDHFEDITPLERVQMDKKCDRNLTLDGYLRGCNFKNGTKVHIAGVGDFPIAAITRLPDPCPLPSAAKMKELGDKEIFFHAPRPVLGDLLYDKGLEYIETFNDGGCSDKVEEVDMLHLRKGTYIRLEVRDVPFDMVNFFDSYHPILVGGISLEEEKSGYMQARLKQHSLQTKLLKTGDPITISIGWRRYQTTPVYAMEETSETGSHKIPRCSPEHTYCLVKFWGPLASPNTELVAMQNVTEDKAVFQITATGVILEFPIKDIFSSDLDVASVSGVLGKVIEAYPYPKVLKHGTTILTLNCGIERGIFIAVDGLGNVRKREQGFVELEEDDERDSEEDETESDSSENWVDEQCGRNEKKAFYLGGDNYMIAAVAGSDLWFDPIIKYLNRKMRATRQNQQHKWTPERCAKRTHSYLNQKRRRHNLRKISVTSAELREVNKMKCEIIFGAYIPHKGEVVPSVFCGNESQVLEIVHHGRTTGKEGWKVPSFTACGSGEEYAEKVLKDYAHQIDSENLTSEELKIICLKALEYAALKDPVNTGGMFSVFQIQWDAIRKFTIDANLVRSIIQNFEQEKRDEERRERRRKIVQEEKRNQFQAKRRRTRKKNKK